MNRIIKNTSWIIVLAVFMLFTNSCEKFLNPEQELAITEDNLYDDWYEYRSIEMGLYALQASMVEQLMIMGELRGDLMTITENADPDMVEIYNFNVSKTNKYASPTNFFKLISACNSFIRVLKTEHPEVLDMDSPINNYDRLYGEALTMRAWAYFNAVRIYEKVPFIPESLTTMEEIDAFIASPGTYIDSVHIVYGKDGYQNDTSYNAEISLEKQLFDLDMVLNYFTDELENDIKAIGVNHYINNSDETWEVTIWTEFGLHALLGHMYLSLGDYAMADQHFVRIMKNTTENLRYHIDNSFSIGNWRNIFNNIDVREHIYTIWFNKANFQQNRFQEFFEPWEPHKYMLKPSSVAVFNWETQWRNQRLTINNTRPQDSEMTYAGFPGDYSRGVGSSFMYFNNNVPITEQQIVQMMSLRARGDERNSRVIMENMDTVVYKYSIDKNPYDQDANYIIYRAAGIHLYLAEAYIHWVHDQITPGIYAPSTIRTVNIINNGSYYPGPDGERPEIGIRGRVGLGNGYDGINASNNQFIHDPYTNEIIGYKNIQGNSTALKKVLEDALLEERALEMAFEGERFYDLMRIAKRNNDPSVLAKRVAAKYPSHRQAEMEALLMDESNWYIHWFE